MEQLERLKTAIFHRKEVKELVEECYANLLSKYDPTETTIFIRLLEMTEQTPRIEEILRVIDFIRFPVKKAF